MQSTIYAADYVRNQDPETNVVRVRPASPEDQEGLRRMLSCLSRESVYLRFHAPLPRAPEWAAAMFANSDRRYGESLVAVADGEVVGHAMYVRLDAGDSAEFAIVVEDRCQAGAWEAAPLRARPEGRARRRQDLHRRRARGEPVDVRPGPLRVRESQVRDGGRRVRRQRNVARFFVEPSRSFGLGAKSAQSLRRGLSFLPMPAYAPGIKMHHRRSAPGRSSRCRWLSQR